MVFEEDEAGIYYIKTGEKIGVCPMRGGLYVGKMIQLFTGRAKSEDISLRR